LKIILKILIFITINALGITYNYGQEIKETGFKENTDFLNIPKLEILIDSAIANNGMVNYRLLEIEAKKANIKAKKRNWTRNFGLQADTRYGTFNDFSTITGDNSSVNLASNTQQLNYNVGLYLKIPIFDIINQRSEVKRARVEIDQAKYLVKFQEDEIKEFVIRFYEDLILSINLFQIQAINLGDARANKEMAEKEFRNGIIPFYEYVRILDITSSIAMEYEKAKSGLLLSKKLLENLTGVEIN
jgi:outer membrane protein TolC